MCATQSKKIRLTHDAQPMGELSTAPVTTYETSVLIPGRVTQTTWHGSINGTKIAYVTIIGSSWAGEPAPRREAGQTLANHFPDIGKAFRDIEKSFPDIPKPLADIRKPFAISGSLSPISGNHPPISPSPSLMSSSARTISARPSS